MAAKKKPEPKAAVEEAEPKQVHMRRGDANAYVSPAEVDTFIEAGWEKA
jgi:hypothetical protein